MPRRKPDQVIEHRIALGHWERERIKNYEAVAAAAVIVPTVGIAAIGVGVGLAGYAFYQWVSDSPFEDIFPKIREVLTPKWRDTSIPVWSDEQREEYRKANPSLIDQVFDGPAILWSMILGQDPE